MTPPVLLAPMYAYVKFFSLDLVKRVRKGIDIKGQKKSGPKTAFSKNNSY